MKKKIIRITTVPVSLSGLLHGQSKFMGQFYEVVGISSNKSKLQEVGLKEGIRVVCVNLTRKITPIQDIVALLKLWFVLLKEKPFIVHSHTPKAGTIGMLAARLAGVPHRLHTIAGLPLLEATGFKRRILNLVEKVTYSSATMVYPNSEGLKQIVLDQRFTTSKKLKVIGHGSSNGINTDYFDSELFTAETKFELRKKLKITPKDFVFIYVGRLVGDKGINELIAAFKIILKEYENVQLLLVGHPEKELDPLFPETEEFIFTSDKIISTGWVDDVRPYFAISDCLVFPSYREGFPNVVMQSGAMGLFSIVTDINGCNEIIQNNLNGFIVPVKNVNAIYKSMKTVLQKKDELIKNKKVYREVIKKNYEQSYIWRELLQEYQTLENQH